MSKHGYVHHEFKKNMHGHHGAHRHHSGKGTKHHGFQSHDNEVDGKECVNYDVSDADFHTDGHYAEGPTGYTGGGSNEKHS